MPFPYHIYFYYKFDREIDKEVVDTSRLGRYYQRYYQKHYFARGHSWRQPIIKAQK
jgi:hypothetical protein